MTPTTRYAVVRGASWAEQLAAYLPDNYKIATEDGPDWGSDDGKEFVIEGEDVAGWTLEGYVIPRLASGLIFATEQFVWMEEDGDAESGPSMSVWLEDEPMTPEAAAARRREEEEEQGLTCPQCGAHPEEGYEVRSIPTRQYGGEFDTSYNCRRCGYKDIAT